jgi:hypothetical protein
MVCFVIFRTDSVKKVLTALADLVRYGKIKVYDPKMMPPETARKVMIELCGKIKNPKEINVIARVNEKGGRVIFSLKKIHPPAHLIVVTPRHGIFEKLTEEFSTYRSLKGFTSPKKILSL